MQRDAVYKPVAALMIRNKPQIIAIGITNVPRTIPKIENDSNRSCAECTECIEITFTSPSALLRARWSPKHS
jgi:hypothetical protein